MNKNTNLRSERKKTNKAYGVLGIIKRNFLYMDELTFILYKATVRPHVELVSFVWCPFKLDGIKEIEKIQKRATKLIIKLKNKPYVFNISIYID